MFLKKFVNASYFWGSYTRTPLNWWPFYHRIKIMIARILDLEYTIKQIWSRNLPWTCIMSLWFSFFPSPQGEEFGIYIFCRVSATLEWSTLNRSCQHSKLSSQTLNFKTSSKRCNEQSIRLISQNESSTIIQENAKFFKLLIDFSIYFMTNFE